MSLLKNDVVLIKRIPQSGYVNGQPIFGTPQFLSIECSRQEIEGDELLILSEGDRLKSSRKYFSTEEIKKNDLIRSLNENAIQSDLVTVDNVLDETDYITTINSTSFTHTSIIGATALTIVAGLVALINAGSELITATDNLDGTYVLKSDYSGEPYDLAVDDNQSFVNVVENITNEYKIIQVKDWSNHNIPHYKGMGFLIGK